MLHLPPPVHGSSMVGQYIKCSSLINNSFECKYINLLASKEISESGKYSTSKIVNFIKTWFQLLFQLINNRPSLCYFALTVTGGALLRDFCLITLLKLFRIKILYHLHNKGIYEKQDNLFFKNLYSMIFNNSKVILLSDYLYSDIQNFVSNSSVYICPNGVPNLNIENRENNEERFQILFLSNLIESKGVYVLLEALSKLIIRESSFECKFVGGEGDISKTDFQARVNSLGLSNNVTFLGKKYGNEKNDIIQKSDLFVFPTYYSKECLPLVLLEAMCFSLPIISTFEGGIPDIIEDKKTGYMIDLLNIQTLSEKIEYLMKNPKARIEMGINGREKFQNEFTLEIFEMRIFEILKKTIF